MSYSLNEVEALAKRATRGAGYSWGMAEEAAKATRWLCAHGIDGVSLLADVLDNGFAQTPDDHRVDDPHQDWQASGTLCPLMTGAALSDFARLLENGAVCIRNVQAPMFLLPFAANASMALGSALEVNCDDRSVRVDGSHLSCPEAFAAQGNVIMVSQCGEFASTDEVTGRAMPDMAAKQALDAFANRTFAPSTEESRRLGAGAGLSDND